MAWTIKCSDCDRETEPMIYTGSWVMGKKPPLRRQGMTWEATVKLLRNTRHPFYLRLNPVLKDAGFDAFVQEPRDCGNAGRRALPVA